MSKSSHKYWWESFNTNANCQKGGSPKNGNGCKGKPSNKFRRPSQIIILGGKCKHKQSVKKL